MKKDRNKKRIKRNFCRFCTKCKKCVSYDPEKKYCKDLELTIKQVWVDEHTNHYKISENNRRCSFFKNSQTGSIVK